MELGAFSISLAVKDLETSRSFYEKFGFKIFAGDASQNWLIMKNGDHVIGLFQSFSFLLGLVMYLAADSLGYGAKAIALRFPQ